MSTGLDARIDEIIAEFWLDAEQTTEDAALRRLAVALAKTEAAIPAQEERLRAERDAEFIHLALRIESHDCPTCDAARVRANQMVDAAAENIRRALRVESKEKP